MTSANDLEDDDWMDRLEDGAVRAIGELHKGEGWVYVDWKDGQITGYESAVLRIQVAIDYGSTVWTPHVSPPGMKGASIKTKLDFYAAADAFLEDCRFSEPRPTFELRGDVITLRSPDDVNSPADS